MHTPRYRCPRLLSWVRAQVAIEDKRDTATVCGEEQVKGSPDFPLYLWLAIMTATIILFFLIMEFGYVD